MTHANFRDAAPAGTQVRGIVLSRAIAQGGEGIVYEAVHPEFGVVLVKEFWPKQIVSRARSLRAQPALNNWQEAYRSGIERFIALAERLRNLPPHPGVMQVREIIPQNNTAYLVMDRVPGRTLEQALEAGGFTDSGDVVRLATRLTAAMEHLHANGLYHRDIAPDNIVITPGHEWEAVLIDFNAAKDIVMRASRTQEGIVKPGYTPIEQYDTSGNEPLGPWTDIYAAAAVLYRCVVGQPPADPAMRLLRPGQEAPLVEHFTGKFPESLLTAIDLGLQPQPDARPQSVGEWREQLEAEQRARAAAEEKARAEAEAKAQAEAAALLKTEAELEAEVRARVEAEVRAEAAAKAEAEAAALLKVEAARRTELEKEVRARVEAEVRAEAKAKAEAEAEAQLKAEAARQAAVEAEVEAKERATAKKQEKAAARKLKASKQAAAAAAVADPPDEDPPVDDPDSLLGRDRRPLFVGIAVLVALALAGLLWPPASGEQTVVTTAPSGQAKVIAGESASAAPTTSAAPTATAAPTPNAKTTPTPRSSDPRPTRTRKPICRQVCTGGELISTPGQSAGPVRSLGTVSFRDGEGGLQGKAQAKANSVCGGQAQSVSYRIDGSCSGNLCFIAVTGACTTTTYDTITTPRVCRQECD